MNYNFYVGGIGLPHFFSTFLQKSSLIRAAAVLSAMLFSGMLLAQDTERPTITSGDRAISVEEESFSGQIIYTLTAEDNVGVTRTGIGGPDVEHFSFDATTGEVTFISESDLEVKPGYVFEVWAEDAAENRTTKTVYFTLINDSFDDPDTGIAFRHQETAVLLGVNFLRNFMYTDSGGTLRKYSPNEYSTFKLFAEPGETIGVVFVDFNTENVYDGLTVEGAATDTHNTTYTGADTIIPTLYSEAGSSLSLTFFSDNGGQYSGWVAYVAVSDDGFDVPVMASPYGSFILEGSTTAGQTVYQAQAIDDIGITAYVIGGDDVDYFTISDNGAVSFVADPDFETKSSYSITVAAEDADGNLSNAMSVHFYYEAPDTNPPPKPAVSFKDNEGDPNDGITADPTLTILGLESQAEVEISRDNGVNWVSLGRAFGFSMVIDGSTISAAMGRLDDNPDVSAKAVGNEYSLGQYAGEFPDSFYFDVTLPDPLTTAQEVVFETGGNEIGTTFFVENNDFKSSIQAYNDASTLTAEDVFEAGKRYAIIVELNHNAETKYYIAEKDNENLPGSFGEPFVEEVFSLSPYSSWSSGDGAAWGKVNGTAQGDANGPNSYVPFSGTFHEGRFYDNKTFSDIWTNGTDNGVMLLDNTEATIVVRQTDRSGNISEVSDAINIQLSESLSIETHEQNDLYYSNPVKNYVQLGSSIPLKSITLYAITGQKVLHIKPNKNEVTFDVSSLHKGVYLMKVDTGITQKTVKLLKN